MAAVLILMATASIVVTDSVAIQLSYLLIGVLLYSDGLWCHPLLSPSQLASSGAEFRMNALLSLSTNRQTSFLQRGQT